MTPHAAVRLAVEADREPLVEVLCRAFERDPFVRWFARSERGMRRYFRIVLRRMIPFGAVYTTDAREGVSVWSPPGTWEMGAAEQLALLPDMLLIVGADRFVPVSNALAALEATRPTVPYYFLALLGTDPRAQRRGVGTALLRPALDHCDREGVVAVLDTYEASNRAWYERRGFHVASAIALPGGPAGWTLVRPSSVIPDA